MKDYTDIVNRSKKKKDEEENKNSSSSGNLYDASKLVERGRADKIVGFDTLESDLKSLGTTIDSIYGGWQTQETMNNTKSAVEAMQKRLDAYQTYQSKYGGTDLSELVKGYQKVLGDWDALTSTYGRYSDADSYKKETTKLNELYSMTLEELEGHLGEGNGIAYTTYGGEDISWQNLYDRQKYTEMANSKEGYAGWNQYQNEMKALEQQEEQEQEDETIWEKIGRYLSYSSGDTSLPAGEISQVVNDKRKDDSYKHPTDDWTPEEQRIFGAYYLEDPEKAYDYATKLNNAKALMKKQEQMQAVADSATSGFWAGLGHSAGSIATAPLGLADYLDNVTDSVAGRPILESSYLSPFEYSQAVQSGITSELNEYGVLPENIPVIGGKGLGDAYGIGMSTVQSFVSAHTLGGLGTFVSYFGQSSASAVDDAIARGATDDQALLYGLASGIAEGLPEGISAMFIKGFGVKDTDALLKVIMAQTGEEAFEEGITTILTNLADVAIMQDNSQYQNLIRKYMANGMSEAEATSKARKDLTEGILYDALSGAISGGVHAGTSAMGVPIQNATTGSAIRNNQNMSDLRDLGVELNTDAYQKYIDLIDSNKIGNAKLGKFYNEVATEVETKYNTERANAVMQSVANRANELGDSTNSGMIASAIQKSLDGEKLSSAEKKALKTDTAQVIISEMKSGEFSMKSTASFDDAKSLAKRTASVLTSKTRSKATGEAVNIESIKKVEGETVLVTSEGEMAQKDVTLSSNDAELLSYAENMSEEKAKLFVEQYDGNADVNDYALYFEMAYAYGETGIGSDSVLKNKGVLTASQASAIYTSAVTNKSNAQQKAIDDINAKYEKKAVVAGVFNDSIIDYKNKSKDGSKVNWNALTKSQRDAIVFAKAFSKVTGVNITFIKSDVKDGKRVGKNGSYNRKTNTIEIDVYAGVIDASVANDSIIPTLSHELTHWMKTKSPAMFSKMREYVMETLALDSKMTSDERISREMERIKKAHSDIKVTEEMAIEEIVARACEDMLANSDTARKMLNRMTSEEQKTFMEKVKEVFENLMEWVNELLSKYKSNSKEAEVLRQYKYRLKELSKMWDKAFAEAVQTNQAMQEEGITDLDIDVMGYNGLMYNLRAEESHKAKLEKNYSEEANIELGELMKRYNKIIDIWKKLGGELNSKFLQEWDNKVGKDRTFTIFKAQAGYKYNVELSSMCKKGVPLFEAIDRIVTKEVMKELNTDTIGKAEKEILYDILKTHKFDIPCAICYVEQARQREGSIINAFIDGKVETNAKGKVTYRKIGWNETLEKVQEEMKANGVDYTFPSLSRDIATDNYTPADISMDEGTQIAFFDALKKLANEEIKAYNKEKGKNRPLIKDVTPQGLAVAFKGKLPDNIALYKTLFSEASSRFMVDKDLLYSSATTHNLSMAHHEFYKLFNTQGGVNGYKTKQGTVVYWGDILGKTWNPETLRNEGGVRNQSNSDFQMYTLLDQAQMYIDFSAKGYYLQAYTKVLAELKLFGLSNGKINSSLIPKVVIYHNADGSIDVEKTMENAGLDENGNPIFDDIEGIPHEEAFMLIEDAEYSKSICGICIGYSDKHISKLLDDSRIQLIIGFHDKTDDGDKRYRGAKYATNYNGRNEATRISDGETVHIGFNQFVKKAEKKFGSKDTVTYNGKTYSVNDTPKLAVDLYLEHCENKLYPAYSQGGVDFSKHPNYYKLLADFGLYDSQGNYAPHKKVTYNMPDKVPYIDANGKKAYMKTEDYIKQELEKELKVRDSIAEALADQSEDGIIPQFINRVNEMYSDRDSKGTQLTPEQVEFFKDSKVRDGKGSLKVVYHGTTRNFTQFRIGDVGYHFGNKSTAQTRVGRGKGTVLMECYLNITNPIVFDEDLGSWDADHRLAQELWKKEIITREEAVDVLFNVEKQYKRSTEDSNKRLRDLLVSKGYDGIVYKNTFESSGAKSYIVFSSNQAKLTTNTNPTDNVDIRYSDRVVMTTERIDSLIEDSTAGMRADYAQKWITSINPTDFINLTTKEIQDREVFDKTPSEWGSTMEEWDYFGQLQKSNQTPYLAIDVKTGQVVGHEGRHRMRALEQRGVTSSEIVIEFREKGYVVKELNGYGNPLETIDSMVVTNQRGTKQSATIKNIIPLNRAHREEIITSYGEKVGDYFVKYSDRDNVSVYEAMGEAERLANDNMRIKADIELLKSTISEKDVDVKRFRSLADYLNKLAGTKENRESLGDALKEIYNYIQTTDNLEWVDVVAKCYDVANTMLNKRMGVPTNYFKEVMSKIRKERVSLSPEQNAEATKLFGNYSTFHKAMFGRINIVNEGTMLDDAWAKWSEEYPAIFNANLSHIEKIQALVDITDTLRTTSSLMGEYEREEATRHLATEIYNQMWNIASDKSDETKKARPSHRKLMEELRKEYEARQAEKTLHPTGETALKYEKLLRKMSEKEKAEVKRAKELGKKRMDEYKDRVEKNAKIQKITQNALTLNKWLTKNSKEEHIPEIMKAPVASLLNAIDFSSKQLLGMNGQNVGAPTRKDISLSKSLEQVHDMVRTINSAQIGEDEITEIYGSFADFPMGFADDVKDLSNDVNNIMREVGDNEFVLNKMTLEELEKLDKIIAVVKSTVTKMNKFLAIRHAEGVANMSQHSMNYMDSLGKAKERGKIGSKMEKLFDWGNALPYYTFKRFGEGGQKVYEALQNGWDKFAFHIKAIIDYTENTYNDKEVKEWGEMVKEFDVLEPATDKAKADPNYKPRYQKIQMSVPQIMSLYCLQKREQAKSHLMGGGIRIADIKVKNKTIAQSEGVILGESDIETIINSLSNRQREVADKLQNFMNTTCTDWGNEVSMIRFGYKAFGEENYFPIQSDKNNLAVNDETEQNNSLFRLLNMSFTKGTIKKANNAIVVSDIFDVFAQHASDMAKYNALALPVLDAFKWYNYKEKIQKGETQFKTKSLKKSLENAFGKDAQNYIVTFLRDINGEQSAGRDVVGKGFFSNAKIASVGFNMRVVALQPTSYLRASAVIDQKYLAKAFVHKPKIDKAQQYCGIALWKSLGFYDINVQNGVTDLIKHNQTVRDKVVEASMKGAEIADKITWGYLWNACELEIRDKRKDLKVGSKEFYEAIGLRLREVIYATQVVDSTMTRSHMMRSRDGWDKMATAFMSEPTISYNMLQDCYMDWKLTERQTGSKQTAFKKHGKKMARVITAYAITSAVCAIVESGFDIFRDDEDEMTVEEFIELYLKNLGSNLNVLNNVPYVKEIFSMLQGFSSSRTDTQWMQYLTYTLTGIGKLMAGEGNAYTTAKNAIRALSYATGLPFYNVWRDITALLDKTDALTLEELEEMFNETIGDIFPSLK